MVDGSSDSSSWLRLEGSAAALQDGVLIGIKKVEGVVRWYRAGVSYCVLWFSLVLWILWLPQDVVVAIILRWFGSPLYD